MTNVILFAWQPAQLVCCEVHREWRREGRRRVFSLGPESHGVPSPDQCQPSSREEHQDGDFNHLYYNFLESKYPKIREKAVNSQKIECFTKDWPRSILRFIETRGQSGAGLSRDTAKIVRYYVSSNKQKRSDSLSLLSKWIKVKILKCKKRAMLKE